MPPHNTGIGPVFGNLVWHLYDMPLDLAPRWRAVSQRQRAKGLCRSTCAEKKKNTTTKQRRRRIAMASCGASIYPPVQCAPNLYTISQSHLLSSPITSSSHTKWVARHFPALRQSGFCVRYVLQSAVVAVVFIAACQLVPSCMCERVCESLNEV